MKNLKQCPTCSGEISKNAKICPKCGEKQKKSFIKQSLNIIIAIVIVLIIIGVVFGDDDKQTKQGQSYDGDSAPQEQISNDNKPEVPQRQNEELRPQEQVAFEGMLTNAKIKSKDTDNDFQIGAIYSDLSTKICNILVDSGEITNWVGKVKDLSTNSEGKGVLSVLLENGVEVTTWNNAISDMFDNTLIEPKNKLYNKLLQLSKGDVIEFSGRFAEDGEVCFKVSNLTILGKVKSPDFIFNFSDINKVK